MRSKSIEVRFSVNRPNFYAQNNHRHRSWRPLSRSTNYYRVSWIIIRIWRSISRIRRSPYLMMRMCIIILGSKLVRSARILINTSWRVRIFYWGKEKRMRRGIEDWCNLRVKWRDWKFLKERMKSWKNSYNFYINNWGS